MKKQNYKIICCQILIFMFSFVLLNVFAASISSVNKIQNEMDSKRKELENNKNKLQGIDQEVNNIKLDILGLNQEISTQNNELNDLNKQLEDAKAKYDESLQQISNTVDKQEGAEDLLRTRLRSVYENGSTNTWDLLFSSNTIMDFIKKKQVISDITEYDQDLIQTVTNQKEYLNGLKTSAELQKIKYEQLTYDKEQKTKALETSKQNLQYKTNQLNSNKTVLNALIEQNRKEEAALSEKLAAEIRQLQAQSGNIVSEKGFLWPFPALRRVTCGYGGYAGHTGMDLSINASDKTVVASKSGKVIKTSSGHGNTYPWSYSYGNYVVIDHGSGQSTLYAHLSSVSVGVGQFVTQGQKIGVGGNTGYSTGPHLHFEIRINGVAKNPANYL